MKKRLVISKKGFEHLYRFPPRSVQAALRNERDIIKHIKRFGPMPAFLLPLSWWHAVDRLEKKGVIGYSRRHSAYVVL